MKYSDFYIDYIGFNTFKYRIFYRIELHFKSMLSFSRIFAKLMQLSAPLVVFAKATWCGSLHGALKFSRNDAEFLDDAVLETDEFETRTVLLFNIGRQT